MVIRHGATLSISADRSVQVPHIYLRLAEALALPIGTPESVTRHYDQLYTHR